MGLLSWCQGGWVPGVLRVRSGAYVMNERAGSNAWVGAGRGRDAWGRGARGTHPSVLPSSWGIVTPHRLRAQLWRRDGACHAPGLFPWPSSPRHLLLLTEPGCDAVMLSLGSSLAWPGSPRAFQALIGSEREGGCVIPSYGVGEESQDVTAQGVGVGGGIRPPGIPGSAVTPRGFSSLSHGHDAVWGCSRIRQAQFVEGGFGFASPG